MTRTARPLRLAMAVALCMLLATPLRAAEIKVMCSAAFKAAYLQLFPEFERKTGHKIVNAWGPAMGTTPQAVPNRIARGEPIDVVIVSGEALDLLIGKHEVDPWTRGDLAISTIGAAVRAGAPRPDISSVEAFKRTLEDVRSIAYSDSVSGVFISTVLYSQLDVSEAVKAKSRMILADPVGGVIAKGEAELGFQQVSELKPIPGIDILGPIPMELQKVTLYSAGVSTKAERGKLESRWCGFCPRPRPQPSSAARA